MTRLHALAERNLMRRYGIGGSAVSDRLRSDPIAKAMHDAAVAEIEGGLSFMAAVAALVPLRHSLFANENGATLVEYLRGAIAKSEARSIEISDERIAEIAVASGFSRGASTALMSNSPTSDRDERVTLYDEYPVGDLVVAFGRALLAEARK